MKKFVVFGPTRDDESLVLAALYNYFKNTERPFIIVTSTCRGWDRAATRYANSQKFVFLLPMKADMSIGKYDGGVLCNEWMESIADEGITKKGVNTPVSSDMVKKLEKAGKKITYLEIE